MKNDLMVIYTFLEFKIFVYIINKPYGGVSKS